MSLVQQKASGMSLASSGGDSPKKPPGRSRLPLPADCPDIRPKSNKKGQAPQFIQSYRDLPEWKDRRVKAKFTETPPEHLNEEYTVNHDSHYWWTVLTLRFSDVRKSRPLRLSASIKTYQISPSLWILLIHFDRTYSPRLLQWTPQRCTGLIDHASL